MRFNPRKAGMKMIDHAHELRRHARKVGRQAGDTPAVMRDAANEIEALRAALSEIRDRIVDHPLYSPLTEDEEDDIGGEAAEFSYLVRVADAALEPQKVGDAEMQAGG